MNLRCTWSGFGCPAELEPARYLREHFDDIDYGTPVQYPRKFQLLLPGVEVPELVGVPCCAQFAVSREQILKRGREEYERMRQVLMSSELDEETSGRIFEYLWHSEYQPSSPVLLIPYTHRDMRYQVLIVEQSFLTNRHSSA